MTPEVARELRGQVIAVYKELLHLGRDYPLPPGRFRAGLHAAFARNAALRDEGEIRAALARAEYVRKEIEALYSLKKYRTMKKRYYGE